MVWLVVFFFAQTGPKADSRHANAHEREKIPSCHFRSPNAVKMKHVDRQPTPSQIPKLSCWNMPSIMLPMPSFSSTSAVRFKIAFFIPMPPR